MSLTREELVQRIQALNHSTRFQADVSSLVIDIEDGGILDVQLEGDDSMQLPRQAITLKGSLVITRDMIPPGGPNGKLRFRLGQIIERLEKMEAEPEMLQPVLYPRIEYEGQVDYSTANPNLHATYVHWAHHHLLAINKALRRLMRFDHNSNMTNVISALRFERGELITKNTAYRDAAARIMAGLEPEPYDREVSHVEEA